MLRTPKTVRSRRLRLRGRAACHRLLGRLLFRCGRLGPARSQFERVLDLRGDDFDSYVHLGRIAYKLGDYAGWRRECGHARRTAPERFARLRHPFELFDQSRGESTGSADEALAVASRRTADRARSESKGRALGREWASDTAEPRSNAAAASVEPDELVEDPMPPVEPDGESRPRPASPRAGDDFTSASERRSFRRRGPIQIAELRSVDLDDLAARLSASLPE